MSLPPEIWREEILPYVRKNLLRNQPYQRSLIVHLGRVNRLFRRAFKALDQYRFCEGNQYTPASCKRVMYNDDHRPQHKQIVHTAEGYEVTLRATEEEISQTATTLAEKVEFFQTKMFGSNKSHAVRDRVRTLTINVYPNMDDEPTQSSMLAHEVDINLTLRRFSTITTLCVELVLKSPLYALDASLFMQVEDLSVISRVPSLGGKCFQFVLDWMLSRPLSRIHLKTNRLLLDQPQEVQVHFLNLLKKIPNQNIDDDSIFNHSSTLFETPKLFLSQALSGQIFTLTGGQFQDLNPFWYIPSSPKDTQFVRSNVDRQELTAAFDRRIGRTHISLDFKGNLKKEKKNGPFRTEPQFLPSWIGWLKKQPTFTHLHFRLFNIMPQLAESVQWYIHHRLPKTLRYLRLDMTLGYRSLFQCKWNDGDGSHVNDFQDNVKAWFYEQPVFRSILTHMRKFIEYALCEALFYIKYCRGHDTDMATRQVWIDKNVEIVVEDMSDLMNIEHEYRVSLRRL